MHLVKLLVNEPKSFPSVTFAVIRRAIRKMWDARGGGLYACGFVITFVWLEVSTLFGEFAGSDSIGGFFSGQLMEMLLRFTFESIQNTIGALIWPVRVIAYSPPWGLVILAALYLLFTYILKKPLEHWLFLDDKPMDAWPALSAADSKE